ncbi:hypothetical protein N9Y26_00375 [bacterium]|nr:hypothetical protein [bacterium]
MRAAGTTYEWSMRARVLNEDGSEELSSTSEFSNEESFCLNIPNSNTSVY